MAEYITTGILFLVMVYQGVIQYLWIREKGKETRELLDRIMSRDYKEFSQVRINTHQVMDDRGDKVEVVRVDELEDRLREGSVAI